MEQEQAAFISAVHLKGYKSIRDVSVELKQGLNIIIGANGSGKTNFFEFLDAVYRSDYKRFINGKKIEVDIKSQPYSVNIKGERVFQSEVKGASYRVEEIVSNGVDNNREILFLNEEKKIVRKEGNGQAYPPALTTLLLNFENPLNNIFKEKISLNLARLDGFSLEGDENKGAYNFLDSSLKAKTNVNTFLNDIFFISAQRLSNDQKLADILPKVFKNEWFIIDELRKSLNQFSPIKDINIDWDLTRRTLREDYDDSESAEIDNIDFQFFVNKEWITWSQLSDGTKRLFYLIGSVTYADENQIILMEEPELGVHPHQLTLLMNFLKAQSLEKQIIISTHSPEVLNCLKEDELDRIIVARHEGKLGTKLYKLTEKEQNSLRTFMKYEASISDYWLQSGFEKDNEEEVLP